MDCCLPNLFVGTLTRETFLAALEKGIGAEVAINFLRQHAHPKVANRVPAVPEVCAAAVLPSDRAGSDYQDS
jgi:transcription initiation factor TFIIH subunit 4